MTKLATRVLVAMLAAAPTLAIAQTGPLSAEARELTEIRIDVVKNALQLSPDQSQYWPAIEGAIRARAEARYQRAQTALNRFEERSDRDFLKFLQARADALSERGAGLKRLADAWQPLYGTLTEV